MKKKIFLFLPLFFCILGPLFAYTVHPTHPRIFLTSDHLPLLRARCGIIDGNNQTEYANQWESHLSEYQTLVQNRGTNVRANAFLYLLTGNNTYANTFISNMNSADRYDLAVAFDWGYHALSASQKQTFGNLIIGYADAQYDFNYGACNGTMDDGWFQRILVFAGLALYNEGINNQKAINYLNRSREWFFTADNAMFTNWEYVAGCGGHYKGNYDYMGLDSPLDIGTAWDRGTDESFLQNFNHVKRSSWWYLFILRAGGGQWEDFEPFQNGDGFMNFYTPMQSLLYRVASRYRDPRAQKFGDLMTQAGGHYVHWNKTRTWEYILWHDKTVPSINLNTFPRARFFNSMGTVIMRTGWDMRKSDANTDVWAIFRCEKWAAVHAHCHQNHFSISRGIDQLAVDSGGYDHHPGDHSVSYYRHTVAHNSMLIDGNQHWYWPNPRNLEELQNEHFYRGFMERYGHEDPGYTYGLGDATEAYPDGKASNFTRQFVFINDKYFVVFDRVSAAQTAYEKVWMLHTVGEPNIEDSGSWQTTEFGFGNAVEGGKKTSPNTKILSTVNGQSKLYLTILQPTSLAVSKLGGPDTSGQYNLSGSYEFWYNGSNHPANLYGYQTTPNMGQWRIELRPQTTNRHHRFLTVLQPCASSASRVENTFIKGNIGQGNREMYGAHIKEAQEPCVVLFAREETKDGGLIDEVNFSVNDTGTMHVLICDMLPNSYHIYKDGNEIADSPRTVSYNDNTLYFHVGGGGNFSITEETSSDPPPAPPTDVHFE